MITIIEKGTSKEQIKEKIDEAVSRTPKKNIKKFAGALNTSIDPLEYQNR